MATKPQSNLPPQAQPWGRYVEESLATLERGNSINGQNSNNNLRQLNSSVQLLSQQQQDLQAQQTELQAQQDYLATFTSYTTSDPSGVTGTSLNNTYALRTLDLSFTLSRDSKVLIESNLEYQASLNSTGWSVLWQLSSYFYIDSPSSTYGAFNTGSLNATNVPTINKTDGGQARISRIVDMAAGSHLIHGYWNYFLSGNSGSMYSTKALLTATVVG